MKIDASLPIVPLKEVPAIAEAAERTGFDALWTSETQHDPFLPCTLIAEHTQKLNFGTAIAVSFARSPATLAYTAWDLAAQSHGRFMLGLGTQVKAHIERRFGMQWPESVVGKLREQIQAVRSFWDVWQHGTKLNFRGEYYKLTLMSPFFNPGPINADSIIPGAASLEKDGWLIPIYIAGVNEGLARLAGELCEGFVVHPFHSARYLREIILPAIQAGLDKAGRDRSALNVSVTAFVATTAKEEAFARSQIAFYASTPSYRPVMAFYGWEQVAEQLSAHAARGEWAQMPELVTDEILHEFCLVTEQDKLPTALKERYAGIADRLGLYTPFVPGLMDERWKGLVEEFNS